MEQFYRGLGFSPYFQLLQLMSINPTIYIDEHEEEENNKNAIKKRKTNLIRDPKKGMVIIQSQHNLNLILRKHSNQ